MSIRLIKRLLFLINFVLTLPLIILTYAESAVGGKNAEKIYSSCRELLALCPTLFGHYLRLSYYWAVCSKISLDACFLFGSMVAHRETTIGAGSVIGTHTIIGRADIGQNVLFAARISVIPGKYLHGRPEERIAGHPIRREEERIRIGDDSWIGEGALILASVGRNCTVAAGSVVLRDVPDNTVVMGNPARKVNLSE